MSAARARARARRPPLRCRARARADDLLQKNCCSFSRDFAISLGVGDVPSWIDRLAKWGTALQGPKKGQLPKPTEMDMRFMEHVMASRVQSRFRMRKWHRLINAAKSKR